MKRPGAQLAAVPALPVADEAARAAADAGTGDIAASGGAATEWEAQVDGKRIRIRAQDEVVIECGRAAIVMRRNGRIVIRGTYVETRSAGTNRIRGGQVRIN